MIFHLFVKFDTEKSAEAMPNKVKDNPFKVAKKFKNGPGRNHCMGGRVEKSKGFLPNSFDRVLLDAPCSALGLRPRLFAGEVKVTWVIGLWHEKVNLMGR